MTNERRVLVHPDVDALTAAVAARFLTKLVDLMDEFDTVNVVLTGGTVGAGTQRAVATSGMRTTIDWARVHFWWGDERFVPKQDPERNEVQAREALLDHIDVPESNIHPFPASDEIEDIDRAAAAYAEVLQEHATDGGALPRFDITFLGVGPDGHIASLFPERIGLAERRPPPSSRSATHRSRRPTA